MPSAIPEPREVASLTRTAARILISRILVFVIPVVVWLAPLNLEQGAKRSLAIASFMILAWMTEIFPHALTGFIGCYLFWAVGGVKFNIAFSGFATETPWFCFGALLFGMMATKSGLARRLAYLVMSRVANSPSSLLLGFVLVSFLLTFIVPSGAARVIIMAAVAIGLMEAYGLSPGSNTGKGIFITLTYGASLFDKMIIAGSGTILARGLIEKAGQVEVLWSRWFLAFLPCALITIFVTWRLALWLFPVEQVESPGGTAFLKNELKSMGKWSALEKRSALLMLFAIGLWMTDFVHHVSPAMIGLGIGLIAALPGLGVLKSENLKQINYLPVFFVATATSMGEVLIQTRAIDTLTGVMFAWMDPLVTNVYYLAIVPFWTAFVYHLFLGSGISMLSTSIPPLMNFAASHGLDPLALGMIWTFAGGSKIFVYQSAVLIVGYSYGYFNGRDLLRFGACISIIESVILFFLVTLYWPLIGIL